VLQPARRSRPAPPCFWWLLHAAPGPGAYVWMGEGGPGAYYFVQRSTHHWPAAPILCGSGHGLIECLVTARERLPPGGKIAGLGNVCTWPSKLHHTTVRPAQSDLRAVVGLSLRWGGRSLIPTLPSLSPETPPIHRADVPPPRHPNACVFRVFTPSCALTLRPQVVSGLNNRLD
jgi:hypothetical protein